MRKFLVVGFLLLSGCVSSAAKEQAAVSARASDQYAVLVESTLNGTIRPADGKPVTAAELALTPPSVKELLQNTIRALYLERAAWHQLDFAVNNAPDPKTLKLDPPALGGP